MCVEKHKVSYCVFRKIPTGGSVNCCSIAAVLLTASMAVFVIFIVTVIVNVNVNVAASETNQLQNEMAHSYEYRCFRDKGENNNSLPLKQLPVGLLVTNRVTHQLLTRLFAIFAREVLDFSNIWLVPYTYNGNLSSPHYEKVNMIKMLQANSYYYDDVDMSMINLEVWMSPNVYSYIPPAIHEAGSSISPGRFGWFVPESLVPLEALGSTESLHYSVFFNMTNIYYSQYILNEDILDHLRNGTDFEQYQNPLCLRHQCVTLLAEHKRDTAFLVSQIMETKSFLNVLWLGKQFAEKIRDLQRIYEKNANDAFRYQRFIIVHWTPSDFINVEMKFKMITMPRCEEWESLQLSNCKYELTPVLKFYSKDLEEKNEIMLRAVQRFSLNDSAFQALMEELHKMRKGSKNRMADLYDEVACSWLKRHKDLFSAWSSTANMVQLLIGGIFPFSDLSRGHQNLSHAVDLAEGVINANPTLLKNYDLIVQKNDGQCKADVVMKAFIHYFNTPRMLGVLGPACSDTVEPIAGISKHTNMAVISYSAEGASFVDRQTYPYFFRTIGSNRQYEDVYIRLMQRFGWRRIAALTEDGQKYTEYISHMEANMKQTSLEFVISKKFLHDATAAEMNKYLSDLKQKHAKIIIADIHNENARMILCEAFKLKMTAYYGYVWFLPVWFSKNWTYHGRKKNDSCTNEELQIAIEGHFSIEHRPFGPPEALMQENITIAEWFRRYEGFPSKYVGFAYDAVWTYALAADKLIRENKDAINNMRSSSVVKRFVELIWQTDFNGLSGRVRFGKGGSRITDLNILQWRNFRYHEVGHFQPKTVGTGVDLHTDGGHLTIDSEAIEWLSSEKPPSDGTYDCSFSILAETLVTDCENAALIFSALMCLMAVVTISLVSFFFWKKRYDRKIKRSAKIMKTFGIDLLSPSRSKFNTLDKWEIPKENVVVNRRLGEGAFGTVYGGEAQLGDKGWTAVAVKTLKAGASTEDRLDFLSEAEAMKRFDDKNIVKLLGVCLQSEPIYTIMEFMLYGDLKTYLLARRHMVNDKIGDESDISPKRLTGYAMDIASGLEYLEQQKYVHRDIACRNCLVNAKRVVKLGDFGMARSIFESDYYRFNRKGMLPVRWMAPESLALGMFTPSSDVWAFGVVLYEIITFGSFPFQGLTNNQVLEYVKGGKTLQIPAGVKPPLEGLLKSCWSQEVTKRPTAAEIVDYISNYPRLLTPCLDFPGASVQMPETESDELELLPKIRRPPPNKRSSTLDVILSRTASTEEFRSDLDASTKSTSLDLPILGTSGPLEIAKTAPTSEEFTAITPDGYSVMSPLLRHQTGESSEGSHQGSLEVHQQTPF